MSAQIDRIYKLAFRKNFTNYEGNFPPDRQVSLGDYGVIKNGYFSRLGNIKDPEFGLKFDILKDLSPARETFKSTHHVNFCSIAKGDILTGNVTGNITAVKPSLEISFTGTDAVFFSSADVVYNEIKNIAAVGDDLLSLYKNGQWKKEYHIITRIIEGNNTVIIISGSDNSKVVIQTNSDVPVIDLADAVIGLNFKNVQQTAYEAIIHDTCQLGIGLSRIYDRFFIKPKLGVTGGNAQLSATLDNNNSVDVVFGDVRPQSLDIEQL